MHTDTHIYVYTRVHTGLRVYTYMHTRKYDKFDDLYNIVFILYL